MTMQKPKRPLDGVPPDVPGGPEPDWLNVTTDELGQLRKVTPEAPVRPHEAELSDTGAELERAERHERDNERDRQGERDAG